MLVDKLISTAANVCKQIQANDLRAAETVRLSVVHKLMDECAEVVFRHLEGRLSADEIAEVADAVNAELEQRLERRRLARLNGLPEERLLPGR